jgi:hypothetical protein
MENFMGSAILQAFSLGVGTGNRMLLSYNIGSGTPLNITETNACVDVSSCIFAAMRYSMLRA